MFKASEGALEVIELLAERIYTQRLSENYIFHLIRLSSKWIMAI